MCYNHTYGIISLHQSLQMKIIIAGAGFGGLRLARKLNGLAGFEVVLIDRFNYHQFQPLFYQVATAGLDASNISFPLRKVFQKSKNIRVRLASILEIKPGQKLVVTDQETIPYDILVLALGADTNFFGNARLAEQDAANFVWFAIARGRRKTGGMITSHSSL